eukprot:TRINITY_DN70198_c0_g1_i1.p1 TRINITY_DN70198_c0_g1~~TRINITY_DN70198_c0_g1_i1.p1  ORF type:complete len:472 (+),score=137.57 TRINITY_DN70198_c0_g1_i1:87-1418(+)
MATRGRSVRGAAVGSPAVAAEKAHLIPAAPRGLADAFLLTPLPGPLRLQVMLLGLAWVVGSVLVTLPVFIDVHCSGGSSAWSAAFGTAYFAGAFTGALCGGFASDRFGRARTAQCTVLALAAVIAAQVACSSPHAHLALRFLGGACVCTSGLATYVLASELLPPRWRGPVGSAFFQSAFAAGEVIPAALAAVVGHSADTWQLLVCICAGLVGAAGVLVARGCVESPVWLRAQGRTREAAAAVAASCCYDGGEGSSPDAPDSAPASGKGGALALLGSAWLWLCAACSFYGLTLSSGGLAGSIYLNVALCAVVEVPAAALCSLGVEHERLGRRGTCGWSCALGGAACLLCLTASPVYATPLALAGKLAVSTAFDALWIFTGELFPVERRSSAVGCCSAAGRIGAMASPQLIAAAGPVAVAAFGVLALSAAAVVLCLPETRSFRAD